MTVIILGICSAFCGYLVANVWTADGRESKVFLISLTVFGFLSGASVGLLLSSILSSATAMVFVAFAEDPEALKVCDILYAKLSCTLCSNLKRFKFYYIMADQINHFDEFHALIVSWEKMHPRSVDWVNYHSFSNI